MAIDKVWLPEVRCENYECKVRPKAKYVPIRKKQKLNKEIIKIKFEMSIAYWNDGNLMAATEGFEVDYDSIVENEMNDKIGLPGYRD